MQRKANRTEMQGEEPKRLRSTLLVLLLVVALVAAACGGDESASSTGDDNSDGGDADGQASEEEELDVVPGGAVVMGLAAEPDIMLPDRGQWGPEAFNVARAIFDPIAVLDEDGVAQPYLVESIKPQRDYEEWIITPRDDVFFHNGDPLDAAALKHHLTTMQLSPLTSAAFDMVDAVGIFTDEEDGREKVAVFVAQPWTTFPELLTKQPAYVAHPGHYDGSLPEDTPIGTGPFVFDGWSKGSHLTTVKNDSYWRDGMPYLDQLDFRFISDPTARSQAIAAGDVDIMVTNTPDQVIELGTTGAPEGFQVVRDEGDGDEMHVLFNNQTGPTSDVELRQAMQVGTNREAIVDSLFEGYFEVADLPYQPTSRWYSDPNWPAFDEDAATAMVEEWEAANGPVELSLTVIASQDNLKLAQALQEQWKAIGIEVEITSLEQSQFSTAMLTGDFDLILLPFYNQADPDAEYYFWDPERVGEPGELSLNLARYSSEEQLELLQAGRLTDDVAERQEIYAQLWEHWAENVPYLWLYHTEWMFEAEDSIHGLDSFTFPDGEPARSIDWGAIFMTEAWVEQ